MRASSGAGGRAAGAPRRPLFVPALFPNGTRTARPAASSPPSFRTGDDGRVLPKPFENRRQLRQLWKTGHLVNLLTRRPAAPVCGPPMLAVRSRDMCAQLVRAARPKITAFCVMCSNAGHFF